MRYGTSHFQTRAAANRFYKAYGETPADVGRKLDAGEIHIGRPERKAGQSIGVDADGRYWIVEEKATIVPCGKIGK